jgi:hypothetical protein
MMPASDAKKLSFGGSAAPPGEFSASILAPLPPPPPLLLLLPLRIPMPLGGGGGGGVARIEWGRGGAACGVNMVRVRVRDGVRGAVWR